MNQNTIFITMSVIAVAYFILGSIIAVIEEKNGELTGFLDMALLGTAAILKLALIIGVSSAVLWWSSGILAGVFS